MEERLLHATVVFLAGKSLQDLFAGWLPAPAPWGPFPVARKWTKGAQGTTWFLDLQLKGSSMTPFETPCIGSQYIRRSYLLPGVAGAIPDICLLAEQSGGENFARRSSRGENPLRGVSKEDTSSLANLWFLSFREERNLGRGLSRPALGLSAKSNFRWWA